MTKEEKQKYNKKIKLYEKLGAEKFQNIVFSVEKLKFKVIKKCFPNFLKHYDKHCDRTEKRLLRNAKTEEEIKDIKRSIQFSKMAIRKEMNQEKNRNYHMDSSRPTEIYKYLEWNKSVHEKSLIADGVLIVLTSIAIACGLTIAIPVLIAEIINAGIDFECINIQNWSICKYKRCEEAIKKKQFRKISHNIDNYGDVASEIDKAISNSEKLPSTGEIISNIEDQEKLDQMMRLIEEGLKSIESLESKG